jgi:ferric-dicitrate binding protein FerR (iron transport regulator)
VLAPGSRLRTPERFGSGPREISLTEHAYFEVASDSARPFLVNAGGVVTRVLGTEFDVRAYRENEPVRVVVRSGRVSVRPVAAPAATARVLGRGDRAVVDSSGTVQVDGGLDVDALLSWTSGRLTFDRAPLHEVVPELERWFDLEIEMDPSLSQRRLSAIFEDEPVDTVLQLVGDAVKVRVQRDGRRVVVSPQP